MLVVMVFEDMMMMLEFVFICCLIVLVSLVSWLVLNILDGVVSVVVLIFMIRLCVVWIVF